MYQRPGTSRGSRPSTQTVGQFYYDYSEDFEKPTASVHEADQRPAMDNTHQYDDRERNHHSTPIKGPESHITNMAKYKASGGRYDACLQSQVSAEEEGHETASVDGPGSSDGSNETPHLDLLSIRRLSQSAPPDTKKHLRDSACQPLGVDLRASIHQIRFSRSSQTSQDLLSGAAGDNLSSGVTNRDGMGAMRCTLDPTLPDFASIFSSFDKLAKSPCFSRIGRRSSQLDDAENTFTSVHDISRETKHRNLGSVHEVFTGDDHGVELVQEGKLEGDEREFDILSPEPISPVQELKCNSLADLAVYSEAVTKTSNKGGTISGDSKLEPNPQVPSGCQDKNVDDGLENSAGASPDPSDPFNIPYPTSPESKPGTKESISSSNKDTLVQRLSSSSDTTPYQEGGIRKKMSLFRLRIAESLATNAAKKTGNVEGLQRSRSHLSMSMTWKESEVNLDHLTSGTARGRNGKSDWMTSRLKRWATDAKRAVRSYVRRTLDRSPRWSE
ncbi:hypothetical protein UVI_02034930 [Ustilaginoidea virens]|uniref:Uncharacterized protein n=1 Tax=Ustilaginoidea virens TaxID=1159556 RepID=A0A1B5KVB9_USTVR|nr:hypothetical protein UVI_02034930 [Ustilaginoidea virens]